MNKILITLALTTGVTLSAFANLNGNGYYRVKNYGSSRWATLVDNTATVDFFAGAADLHSLELTNNTAEILSDAGSVVYINQKSNSLYDVASQGVTLESLVDNNVNIRANGTGADGQAVYMLYGTYKGATKYIGDANILTSEEYGKASLNVSNVDFNKWYIIPIDANTDNYFGAVPSVKANSGLFTSLFTSFAYKPYSSGVIAYYIARVGFGMAEMIEITGAVPPGSPVVIKCAGNNVSDNRMQIMEMQDALPSNSLTGVYFNYSSNANVNQVKYDPQTMRVLGVCKDGSLGFVVADNLDYIPSNTAYLKVPAGSVPEIKCVSSTDYEANLPEAPENFSFGENGEFSLYPQGEDNYTGTFEIPAPTDGTSDINLRFYASSATKAGGSYIGAYNENVNLNKGTSDILPFAYDSQYYWVLQNWTGGTLQVTINLQYQYVKFFSEMAGINTIYSPDGNLIYDGSVVYCSKASRIAVYNMAGQLVAESNGNSIDIASLPKGTYVAVANGKSLKIQH